MALNKGKARPRAGKFASAAQEEEWALWVGVGRRVAKVRIGLGLSHSQFAKAIGCSERSLYYYENGQTRCPLRCLRRLVQERNIDIDWLMFGPDTGGVRYQHEVAKEPGHAAGRKV